jgi:non-specific serine/threonine protein kinase
MHKAHLALLSAEIDNLRAALSWCQETAGQGRRAMATTADSAGGEFSARLEEAQALLGAETRAPGCSEWANPGSDAETGLRLAHALYWLWIHDGYVSEGLQWLERALIHGSDAPVSLRAHAFFRASRFAGMRGERERSFSFIQSACQGYEEVLTVARATGDRSEIAAAVLALADVTHAMGDFDAAWTYGVEARQRMAELGNRVGLISSLEVLSVAAGARGDLEAVRLILGERLSNCREFGTSDYLMHALGAMAHLMRNDSDYARAHSLYAESLVLRQEVGDQFALAQSLEDLAVLAGREQQNERAIRILGAAQTFCESLGAKPPVAFGHDYEQTVAEGRAALGEAAFAAVWAEGRAMSLDQVIEYALGAP